MNPHAHIVQSAQTTLTAQIKLAARDVHIWRLDLTSDALTDPMRVLSDVEVERGNKFVFERDRNRFLRAKYCVRKILGAYLNVNPREVPIAVGVHGKPFLAPQYRLAFNLSHSGGSGVLAVGSARDGENNIGIDLEELRRPSDARQLAQSVFSPTEIEALDGFADEALDVPFLTCWTRKEAYLKALGVGLTIEPKSITVGVESAQRRLVLARVDGEKEGEKKGEKGDRKLGESDEFVDVVTLSQRENVVVSLAVVGGYERIEMLDYMSL